MHYLHAVHFDTTKFNYEQANIQYYKTFTEQLESITKFPSVWRFNTIWNENWLHRMGYTQFISQKHDNGIETIIAYKKNNAV
jgi:hypothetical protein